MTEKTDDLNFGFIIIQKPPLPSKDGRTPLSESLASFKRPMSQDSGFFSSSGSFHQIDPLSEGVLTPTSSYDSIPPNSPKLPALRKKNKSKPRPLSWGFFKRIASSPNALDSMPKNVECGQFIYLLQGEIIFYHI